MKKKLGLYIHLPFCMKKCSYCGFLSFDDKAHMMDDYMEALKKEIRLYMDKLQGEYEVDSIFFGGGTPTLVGPERIGEILKLIGQWRIKDCEITAEGNPKTFSEKDLTEYREKGVTRLSIGCQSLDQQVLKNIGRIHSREDFLRAFEAARKAGFDNVNVDLMFAVPGQDMKLWKETLKEVIDLGPEHISFYSLQIEEGTPYYDLYKMDKLAHVSDEEERRMHHEAISMVKEAGYEHYEISNCAKKGKGCRHNLKYWSMEDYLGLGLGASSFVDGERFKNTDDLDEYLLGKGIAMERHKNDQRDTAGELVFTGLRKKDGFTRKEFFEAVGQTYDQYYSDIIDNRKKYIEDGLLIEAAQRIYLTEAGIDKSNEIMADFV